MNRWSYPSRQKARWPDLSKVPFKPTGALARSFQEVPSVFWSHTYYHELSALGWLLNGQQTPHQIDWLRHLIRCGADPAHDCQGQQRFSIRKSWSASGKLISRLSDPAQAAHAQSLLSVIREERVQQNLSPYGGLDHLLCEELMKAQDVGLVVEAFRGHSPTCGMSLSMALVSVLEPQAFRIQAAQALVEKGMQWGPVTAALPRLVKAIPNHPGFWTAQVFAAWDRAVEDTSWLAWDEKTLSTWRHALGQAVLNMPSSALIALREGMEQRLSPDERSKWAPELPALFALGPAYSNWWSQDHWQQVPALVQWAVEWGLPNNALLPDKTTWPEQMAAQFQGSSKQAGVFSFSKKEALKNFWEALEHLAVAGHRLDRPVPPRLIQSIRESHRVELSSSMEDWLAECRGSQVLLFAKSADRWAQLLKASAISKTLPDAVANASPKPRF